MKFKPIALTAITLSLLITISGCKLQSDDSSSNNVSFRVVSTDACGNVTGIPDQDILVYDEDPKTNPSSTFSTLKTDNNGRVTISDVEGTASFTLNSNYFGNTQLIYSFYDIAPGNHTFRLSRSTGETDICSCQTYTIDAELLTGNTFDEVEDARIFWGTTSGYLSPNFSGTFDATYTFRKCGNPNTQISVMLETNNDEFLYGQLTRPNTNGSTINVLIDKVAQKNAIPEHDQFASINSGNIVNGNFHMITSRYNSANSDYPFFDRMNEELQYSNYSADIESRESGIMFDPVNSFTFAGDSTLQLNTTGLSLTPSLNNATFIELANPGKKEFSITSDIERDTNLAFSLSRFSSSDGGVISWYTYGPATNSFELPSIQPQWEQIIDNASLTVRYVAISDIADAETTSQAIALRRFLNGNGYSDNKPYTERSTYIVIDATLNKQASSNQQDKSELVIDNY